mmetsp:Transcript_132236/g.263864  ORF Transcript_132236/g.263864 Transcript_132236/m.263864 type:complete len:210 (+) Transcript_132236:367-996(+)
MQLIQLPWQTCSQLLHVIIHDIQTFQVQLELLQVWRKAFHHQCQLLLRCCGHTVGQADVQMCAPNVSPEDLGDPKLHALRVRVVCGARHDAPPECLCKEAPQLMVHANVVLVFLNRLQMEVTTSKHVQEPTAICIGRCLTRLHSNLQCLLNDVQWEVSFSIPLGLVARPVGIPFLVFLLLIEATHDKGCFRAEARSNIKVHVGCVREHG